MGKAQLCDDDRGSVAIIFGLTLIPLIMACGGAVDFLRTAEMRSRLSRIADAAALAAAKQAAVAYSAIQSACLANPSAVNPGGYSGASCSDMTGSAVKIGVAAGETMFAGVDATAARYMSQHSITVTQSGQGNWSGVASYQAAVPTSILKIANISTMPLSGSSTSTISFGANYYLNVYLLLDNSMSMGIGSSATDIANMQSLTGCAFGCHETSSANQYYYYPKSQGIRFRIDDLRDATSALVTSAQNVVKANSSNHIQMGVFTFDNSVNTIINTTSNLSSVATAVKNVDLPTVDDGTRIDNALSWTASNTIIGNGSGASASTPAEVVFLVTDGVEDNIYTGYSFSGITNPTGIGLSWWGNLAGQPAPTSAISSSWCDQIKSKGVTVAVVYTTYVPFQGTEQYDRLVGPFASNIPTSLSYCASPGYFFTASSPSEITSGMQQLFNKAIASSPLRLKS